MTDYANGSTPRILLRAYLTSDHVSDATGKTIAVTISKNGAAFGNPSAGATNATEIANGWYYVDLSATDTGTNGPLIVRGTAASTDTAEMHGYIVPATNGRLSSLPATACTTNASLLTSGAGTDQLSVASGRAKADTVYWNAAAVSVPTNTGVPNVNVNTWNDLTTVALPLVPTTAGRTLDVSTGGEAGLDWANVGSPTTTLALTGTTIANLTNAPTAGDFTATMKTSLNSATPAVTISDKTGFSLTAAYDASKTASQAGDAMALTSAYNFAKGTVAMTESYAAQAATMTPIQALYQAVQHLGESSISGTTKTVKKRDGSTTAKTYTLDSSTAPTSITEAT